MSIGPGLVICIPTLGRTVSLNWAFAFKQMSPPLNFHSQFNVIHGKPVAQARNEAAIHAMAVGAKYLYFIGDDTINPPEALKQLIYRLENDDNAAVVGGVYCSKSNPPAPLVFRGNGRGSFWDWKIGEYFEVTGLGMDATMIRVETFHELYKSDPTKPFFKTVDTDGFLDATNNQESWTEDLYFLERVRNELGKKVMCDGSILCDHVETSNGKVYKLPPGSKPYQIERGSEDEWTIYDLGCGPIFRQFPEGRTIRCDLNEAYEPDYRVDVSLLPFESNSADRVYSSHVLEHFDRAKHKEVIKEWVRILKPGRELWLVLPDITWAAEKITGGKDLTENEIMQAWNVFYGGQSDGLDYHYNGFTPASITALLKSNGCVVDRIEHQGFNMNIFARKEALVVTMCNAQVPTIPVKKPRKSIKKPHVRTRR